MFCRIVLSGLCTLGESGLMAHDGSPRNARVLRLALLPGRRRWTLREGMDGSS